MTDLERLSRVEKRAKEAELTLEQLKKYVEILKNNSGKRILKYFDVHISTPLPPHSDQSTVGSAKVGQSSSL